MLLDRAPDTGDDPFAASDDIATHLQSIDWGRHPLGPPARWPAVLRGLVRSMLRSRGPMFVCWGARAHLLYNGPYAGILRDKHPAALGAPFREVWSEVGPELDAMLRDVMAGNGQQGIDTPFRVRREGREETACFSFVWNPVLDEDGTVQGFYCTAFETTAAVEAEHTRAEEMSRQLRIFEQAPAFVAVLSGPQHVFRQANPAYLEFVGRRDIIGRPVREVVPEAVEQGWGAVLDEVLRTGVPFVGRGAAVRLRREGRETAQNRAVDFVFQPLQDEGDEVSGIVIQGYDVTEHKETQERLKAREKALRESEARFRTMADVMPQMVWSTRPDGHHDYYNRRWYAFTGMPEGSTDGDAWSAMFHPDDQARARKRWRHSLDTGETYEIEYRLRHRSGDYRWVLGRALPVRDEAGRIVRWMGTCTDIHDQMRVRDLLREEDRRKDEFLAMLAHELRNPLAPITSAVALLGHAAADPSQVRRIAALIGRQAGHMKGLIDDLLDVSRVTRGQVSLELGRVDLSEVLAEALEQIRPLLERRDHRIELSLRPGPLLVNGDPKRLVQVFSNILANSVKYTPSPGRIVVEGRAEDGEVSVVVRDNGQGMAQELLDRVFELFVQGERTPDRSQGGLGIGLALVRRIVELHGGRVVARSDGPGRGSEFEVTLVRAEAPPEAVRPGPADPGVVRGSPSRVLVVDDNHDAGQVLALLLRVLGHEVYVETRASKAMETARAVLPEVCLLDIGLPDADGRELGARLRALPGMERVRLAALSGYGQPRDVEASRAAGMDHFTKPVDPDRLSAWLDEAVEPAAACRCLEQE